MFYQTFVHEMILLVWFDQAIMNNIYNDKSLNSLLWLVCSWSYREWFPQLGIPGHYYDVKITSVLIAYSTVCSGADQRKHQNSASLAFVREIHRWMRKLFPFDYVIMERWVDIFYGVGPCHHLVSCYHRDGGSLASMEVPKYVNLSRTSDA